jgi:type IV pilus assembly protein PilQ
VSRGDAVVVKVAQVTATATATATPIPTSTSTSTPTPTPNSTPTDDVLSRRVDEAAVEHPATAVRAARARRDGVALALDGEVARFEVIELANPPRLAIDLFGVASAPRAPVALAGAFKQARFGRDAGKVRVVLDAAGDLPRSEVRRVKGGLAVVMLTPPAMATATSTATSTPTGGGAFGATARFASGAAGFATSKSGAPPPTPPVARGLARWLGTAGRGTSTG